MLKPILIGISPNTESDDVWLAARRLFSPDSWRIGPALPELEAVLKQYFNLPYCYLVNAGRTALYLGLKSLNLKPGDEVIHLDFTCAVVPEAVVRAGGKPLGVKDLTKAKISPRTRAIISQHIFGVPDNLGKIAAICQRHRLVLIEDLAHSLGARYQGKPVGSFGDLTMLSFGRDKIISSVFGGALLSKKRLVLPALSYPSRGWILKQLFHPLLMALAVPSYFWLGKYLIYLSRKFNLITLPLNELPPALLPNALAELVLNQWRKLNKLNRHRRRLAAFYARALHQPFNRQGVYLRFPLKLSQPLRLLSLAKSGGMLLVNWYESKIINLPTHIKINLNDARRVVDFINRYADA